METGDRGLGERPYCSNGQQAVGHLSQRQDKIDTIEAGELEEINAPAVFDVRKPGEFTAGHLEFAKSTPLDYLNKYLNEFPNNGVFYLHCEGGYRSVIANSILKKQGIHNGIDVLGGYNAITNTNLPVTDYVCPSTLN